MKPIKCGTAFFLAAALFLGSFSVAGASESEEAASVLSGKTSEGAVSPSSVLEGETDEALSAEEADAAVSGPEDSEDRWKDANAADSLEDAGMAGRPTDEESLTDAEEAETDRAEAEAATGETLPEENAPLFLTANEIQTLNMKAFTESDYKPSYTTLAFSKADGIAAKTILAEAENIIISQEGNYTSVNKDDNGALSIGRLQWHGTRALNLLKTILTMDNQEAYDMLGDSLYNEIVSASSSSGWSSRTLSSSEASAISDLLGTANGKAAQDALADSDVAAYLNQGYDQGITNAAALVYYADIANQYGTGGAKTCGTYAYNVAGKSWSKVKLNELHIAAICYNYNKFSSSNWYTSAYIPRRRTVYQKVVSLGWTYCNSGDSTIPYDEDGTTGTAWLQRALNTYQNAGLTVNGNYDSATISAVKKFQKSEGLDQDGYAGLQTSSRLIYRLYYNTAVYAEALPGTVTDIVKTNGTWTYTVNGTPDYTYTGLAKNSNGWWYVEDGVVTFSYTGFAENENGKWYCEDSKVTFKKNDVLKDKTGAIGTKGDWWYIVGSKVQTSYTGVADYKNTNGWWYVKNGKVDFSANTVAKNKNGWWYVSGGKVDFSYNGFGKNGNGKWYCESGKVTFNKNSVIKDTTGAIGTKGTWYYVVGSKVQTSFTGLADYKNSNGWWYIRDGKVDFSYNGIAENKNGWWYLKNGKVDFSYTGSVKVSGKTYSVNKGRVNR